MFTDAWFFGSAFIGGTLLSFASHGADHMMVQRVLSCKDISDARKAIKTGIKVTIFKSQLELKTGFPRTPGSGP